MVDKTLAASNTRISHSMKSLGEIEHGYTLAHVRSLTFREVH